MLIAPPTSQASHTSPIHCLRICLSFSCLSPQLCFLHNSTLSSWEDFHCHPQHCYTSSWVQPTAATMHAPPPSVLSCCRPCVTQLPCLPCVCSRYPTVQETLPAQSKGTTNWIGFGAFLKQRSQRLKYTVWVIARLAAFCHSSTPESSPPKEEQQMLLQLLLLCHKAAGSPLTALPAEHLVS